MTVQDVVKAYRKQAGSLRRFGAAVGVSHEEVRNWESGKHIPAHDILMPLLRGDYGDWRTRFAVDVLAALYPALIRPSDRRAGSNRVRTKL